MTSFDPRSTVSVLSSLPVEAKDWLTTLPWEQRRYVLSLCHLVCATPSNQQAEFLDAYTAEGLLSHIDDDTDTRQRVNKHLSRFRSKTELDDDTVRRYIRQAYMHSVQDARSRPDLYLETALKLMGSAQEHSSVLSYILGFEILKLLFAMSWEQHERLYHLQPNQDEFNREYIRPVQDAHKRHGFVTPKDENNFFARREYFIRTPKIRPEKMAVYIIEAFSADKIIELGFSLLRHPNAILYDHAYIYGPEKIGPAEESVAAEETVVVKESAVAEEIDTQKVSAQAQVSPAENSLIDEHEAAIIGAQDDFAALFSTDEIS